MNRVYTQREPIRLVDDIINDTFQPNENLDEGQKTRSFYEMSVIRDSRVCVIFIYFFFPYFLPRDSQFAVHFPMMTNKQFLIFSHNRCDSKLYEIP